MKTRHVEAMIKTQQPRMDREPQRGATNCCFISKRRPYAQQVSGSKADFYLLSILTVWLKGNIFNAKAMTCWL